MTEQTPGHWDPQHCLREMSLSTLGGPQRKQDLQTLKTSSLLVVPFRSRMLKPRVEAVGSQLH